MTEEAAAAGSIGRLVGTNNLQRTADTLESVMHRFTTTVGKAEDVLSKFNAVKNNTAGGPGSNNSHTSMGGGKANGGGANAAAGLLLVLSGSGSGGGGSHRSDGPADLFGDGGGGSGGHRGACTGMLGGNGGAVAMAVAAAGVGAVRKTLQGATQAPSKAYSASDIMGSVAYQSDFGNGSLYTRGKEMFHVDGGNRFAQSNVDDAGGASILAQRMGTAFTSGSGSVIDSKVAGSARALIRSNPNMTYTQAAQHTQAFASTSTYNSLRTIGVHTWKGGKPQSIPQIAADLLASWPGGIPDKIDANWIATFVGPGGGFTQTVDTYIQTGMLSPDQVEDLRTQVISLLKGKSAGVSSDKMVKLLTAKQNDKKANKALSKLHIGDDNISREKTKDASSRQSVVDGLDGFESGLKKSTDAISSMNTAINKFKNDLGISKAQGFWRGNQGFGGLKAEGLNLAMGMSPLGSLAGFGKLGGIGGGGSNLMSTMEGSGGGSKFHGSSSGIGGGSSGPSILPWASVLAVAAVGAGATASGGGHAASHSSGHPSRGGGGGGRIRLAWPVTNHSRLTAGFNQKGTHWAHRHTGQDIAVPTGTPVMASAAGTVIKGFGGAYGLDVRINHGGGLITHYAHNSSRKAAVGQRVRQGQVIAHSGATGNVTGPHVHFGVWFGGKWTYPMAWLTGGRTATGGV